MSNIVQAGFGAVSRWLGSMKAYDSNASLEQLIADAVRCGAITSVSERITSESFPLANGLRIGLKPVDLGWDGRFAATSQVPSLLESNGYSPRPATMRELVWYAGHGWDRKTTVAAFGEFRHVPASRTSYERMVGVLQLDGEERSLTLGGSGPARLDNCRFLAELSSK